MVRKSVIDKYNLKYDTQYPVCTDYKFWIELLNRTEFANLTDKPYLFYRNSHDESITTETMRAEKIDKRDEIVNEMRFLFFDRFGLKISKNDYDVFKKFYCYKRNILTATEYQNLIAIVSNLIEQGKVVMQRPDLWEAELNFWLEFAKQRIDE